MNINFDVTKTIKGRKSVRTFDGNRIKESDRSALESFIEKVSNPFDVPVEFRLLDASRYDLKSPVVLGSDLYLAAKVKRCKNFELGFGYSFETACLYAHSLGLGTVILAATLKRSSFEKALDLNEDEVMPTASPIGYPAQKQSLRESLMRKSLNADDRIAFEKLFFDGNFDTGLKVENAREFALALDMVRLAPSATNKQPWRAVVDKDTVHFYEMKSIKDSPLGDIQKVDMGIALAHFDLTMKERGYDGKFIESDPGIKLPENVHYIISYKKVN